jgi:hypothetical protein
MHPTYSQTVHTGFARAAYHEPNQLDPEKPDRSKPTKPQLIVWKGHAARDREHDYHDSLHSTEVAQRYPHIGDFIAS